jgi:hypothetical protein
MRSYEVVIDHIDRGRVASSDAITVSARTAAEAKKYARIWANDEWGRSRSCNLLPRRYRARLAQEG